MTQHVYAALWLEDAGFFPPDQISITVEKQKLVIDVLKEHNFTPY